MVHTYFQVNGFFKHETLYLLASAPTSYEDSYFDQYNNLQHVGVFGGTRLLQSWFKLPTKASLANPIIECAVLLT